jgi:hypothetical protein
LLTAAIELSINPEFSFLGTNGRRAGFLLLMGFVGSFGFIRMSTRLIRSQRFSWWPGNVSTKGGLHLHHFVFGIVFMLLAGFFAFTLQPDSPWLDLLAVVFGVGAGLTLDEFALWLHLEDVYWSDEGRRSIDAVVVATIIGGAFVLGLDPLEGRWEVNLTDVIGVHLNADESEVALAATVAFNTIVCATTAVKGKIVAALVGVFIPPVAYVGAIRLAKPQSIWARRRYAPGSAKLTEAERRDEREEVRIRRWQDRIGGAPTPAPVERRVEDRPS